jgi:arylsulfatase A-like enzyme
LCNPLRASLLMGLQPTTTGIYGLAPSIRSLPQYAQRVSLSQYFAANGWRTLGAGKIWHTGTASGGKT